VDETLTDEVSDDEEMANDDAESLSAEDPSPAECLPETGKVRQLDTIMILLEEMCFFKWGTH